MPLPRVFVLPWIVVALFATHVVAFAQPAATPAPPASASLSTAPTGLVPISRLREKAAGVPVLLGQTVRVRGWASVGQGELRHNGSLHLYIQDAHSGIRLAGPMALPFHAGEPLDVTGTLVEEANDVMLRVTGVERAPARAYAPAALPITNPAAIDTLMGRMVRYRGIVASRRQIPVGETVGVLIGDSLVYAVRFHDSPSAYTFSNLTPGQQVEITGVLGRYRSALQVYPRTAADVRAIGFRPSMYRVLAFITAGLLLLALAWAVHLVQQGRRRLDALTSTQRHFRLLFSRAETGVVVAEPTDDGIRILRANRAVARLVGLDRKSAGADFTNIRFADYLLHDESFIRGHVRALTRQGRHRMEVKMRGPNGEPRDVVVESYRVEEGESTLYFLFFHDITQQMAHERALVEARERAESFARMQSTFLRNMSHELRTPLAGIIGFAEVLSDELEGEQRQFSRFIHEGGRRLLNTLQDVLDLTRIASGTGELDVQTINAVTVLRQSYEQHAPDAKEAGVALHTEMPPVLVARHDPRALQRVVDHLLANALKFTPAGGSITLRLDQVEDRIRLVVEDTGIGMSESFQETLFSLCAQESAGYARSHEGMGLGLHLVRTLVHQMHGSITVESARGVGTTMTVDLPVRHDAALVEPNVSSASPVSAQVALDVESL